LLTTAFWSPIASAQNPNASAQARAESPYYARVNTFGGFGAYSGDSSHILLGAAQNRKLVDFGVSYNRRLFLNRIMNWQYSVEILPVALESDPLEVVASSTTTTFTSNPSQPITVTENFSTSIVEACHPASGSGAGSTPTANYSFTYAITCSRQWTIGEAMSPIGFAWNFLPRHSKQPFVTSHGGYMYSTQPIPVASAGSFNFTFDVGAGLEVYRTKTKSIRFEYRYHHISNHNTANANPGIDNGLFQATYAFGR
jgi:opacity protein-like surface antigen